MNIKYCYKMFYENIIVASRGYFEEIKQGFSNKVRKVTVETSDRSLGEIFHHDSSAQEGHGRSLGDDRITEAQESAGVWAFTGEGRFRFPVAAAGTGLQGC